MPLLSRLASLRRNILRKDRVESDLDANGGADPYTHWARNNGSTWLKANEEPEIVHLLNELFSAGPTNGFGQAVTPKTNENDDVTVHDLMIHGAMARRRAAMGYED